MGPFNEGWNEADVEAVIARGNPDELIYVPIVVGMNSDQCDLEWAENVCISLASHPHFNVRGNAVLAFGHIARTSGELSLEKITPIISQALNDSHEYVRGHANSAACDLQIYLNVLVPGYDENETNALLKAVSEMKENEKL